MAGNLSKGEGKYNLIVIGGGSAGLMVAAGASGLGARVALVERGKMGGDCLNYGCVPSKALLHNARLAWGARAAAGGNTANLAAWPAVAARVQGVIDAIAPHDSVERFESLGVEVFQGHGRLAGRGRVRVELPGGPLELHGKAIVIATGSGPMVPPIPGLAEAGYLTNETVFSQATQPPRLLVMGGGPIGLELGQAFARLGSEVHVVEMLPRIMPREDADAAQVLADALAREGVRLHTGMRVTRVEAAGGAKRVTCQPMPHDGDAPGAMGNQETVLEVDAVLVAVGRRAALDGLGLEEAGVATANGRIVVDSQLRTTARGVWAAGDIAGPWQFTHMAGQHARVVIQNALLPFKTRLDTRVVPWCTFTSPEVARVGLSEDEAARENTPHQVIRIPFSGNDRAVCDEATEGFLKILTRPGRGDILGCTVVGPHAGEMIHEAVLAMRHGLKLGDLANTIHVYPTLSEAFRRAGDEFRKGRFTPTAQKLFGAWLRWHRR